jgi:hypothetical protein
VVADPVPQRLRSPRRLEAGSRCSDASSGGTPATYSHDAASERVQWLPPADYRVRHDVGLSGYAGDGLPDPGFHGWWAERNGAFADLMVRTGWRLTEQASLTAFEVPTTSAGRGHQRFRLPASIAKADPRGGVYVADSVVRQLAGYVALDASHTAPQRVRATAIFLEVLYNLARGAWQA